MILIKMNKLGIDTEKYSTKDDSPCFNFVLINPSTEFHLQPGDVVYLLKPGNPVIQNDNNMFHMNDSSLANDNGDEYNPMLIKPSKISTPKLVPDSRYLTLKQQSAETSSPKSFHMPNSLSGSMKSYLNTSQQAAQTLNIDLINSELNVMNPITIKTAIQKFSE